MRRLRGGVGAALAGLDPLLQRARQSAVHLRSLARQQVVVDHLAQQRMAEAVALVVHRDDDVARHRLAERVAQAGRVEPRHGGHERVVRGGLAGEPADQLLGRRREPLHAQHQRVAERGRQRAAAVEAGGEDLLGVEGVPLAAPVDAPDELRLGPVRKDALELLGQLVGREPRQLEEARVGVARELSEQRAERMAAVQLVRAVGADDQDPLAADCSCEEPDEVARRAVRPVQVLDDEEDGARLGERVEKRQERLEDARLGGLGAGAAGAEAREYRVERCAEGGRERFERGVSVSNERPERGEERGIGKLVLAQLHAVA